MHRARNCTRNGSTVVNCNQLNKDEPYSIDLAALEKIGSSVYDIFWKLKEYEATFAVV